LVTHQQRNDWHQQRQRQRQPQPSITRELMLMMLVLLLVLLLLLLVLVLVLVLVLTRPSRLLLSVTCRVNPARAPHALHRQRTVARRSTVVVPS
jgi:hypothetical protein